MEQERQQKKRMVWRKAGVVGEFRYLRVYDYDRQGFIEFLYDLGILPAKGFLNVSEVQAFRTLKDIQEQYRNGQNRFSIGIYE
jgi:hypothetical protein